MTEPELHTSASSTSIKRKIDEAFDALDDALRRDDRPSPPKRANTSFYGSLAKYGIKTFNKPVSFKQLASTPTLSALLSRSRSKTQRKPLAIPQGWKTSSATPDYSPSSTEAFFQRLSTFSLPTYSSKPPQIDAVAASMAGWINEGGKDRLYCAICKVAWVVASRDGMSRDAANALVEKQRKSLVEMHKEGCPWRVRQCDPLVYRIPLQSPTGLARQVKSNAAELDPVMDGVSIQHPMSSMQVQSLMQTISSVPDPEPPASVPPPDTSLNGTEPPRPPLPSTNAILASLFGWSLVPVPPPDSRKPPSSSHTALRTHSRASSVPSFFGSSRESTPTPATRGTPPPFFTLPQSNVVFVSTPANDSDGVTGPNPAGTTLPRLEAAPRQRDAMLQCRMCQRRVGLWAFALPKLADPASPSQETAPSISRPQRHFDILREHRSYCPYAVKSTPLPSVPAYPAPSPTLSSSFSLIRTGTSSSLGEGQTGTSTFNLRRTTSLLSSASALARTGTISPSTLFADAAANQNLVEGWRAVLSVVLRFGMAERSRLRPLSPNPNPTPPSVPGEESVPNVVEKDEDDEMHGVAVLVEGVKQHGGKQLLSYVRSLLG